jgi:hypothetical protein
MEPLIMICWQLLWNNILNFDGEDEEIELYETLRLIYPTEDYVLASNLGDSVTCLKMNEKKWIKDGYPRELFCRFEVKDEYKACFDNNIHHTKALFVHSKSQDPLVDLPCILYIGSHNMSGGAWGTFKDYGF